MLEAVQNVVTYIGAFVLVLSVVVFVHEFGHFQAARWRKIAIDTFSIGFGKSLASWRDKQGVDWKIGALPLGGYVKFKDDADAISSHPVDGPRTPEEQAAARAAGLFHAQKVSDRAFVVAAGPLANFIFSTLVFALLFMFVGKDFTDYGAQPARIGSIAEQSAAAAAGLKPGDQVTAIDDRRVAAWGDLQAAIRAAPEQTVKLSVLRDGAALSLNVTPKSSTFTDPKTGIETKIGLLGVAPAPLTQEQLDVRKLGPVEAVGAGAGQVWTIISSTISYIGNIITGRASAEHLAGPLGIMDQSGKVLQGSWGDPQAEVTLWDRVGSAFLALVTWAAILSVAVGFVNLLPVPVLDGGHLLFYSVEAVRGRPLSARAQELGFRAGFAVLISLFLFATWNDVHRLFLS